MFFCLRRPVLWLQQRTFEKPIVLEIWSVEGDSGNRRDSTIVSSTFATRPPFRFFGRETVDMQC